MLFFFFNDTATTEIYTLSLHDALPILADRAEHQPALDDLLLAGRHGATALQPVDRDADRGDRARSEEHTSELQSRQYLVCRLLLEKKKNKNQILSTTLQNSISYTTLST